MSAACVLHFRKKRVNRSNGVALVLLVISSARSEKYYVREYAVNILGIARLFAAEIFETVHVGVVYSSRYNRRFDGHSGGNAGVPPVILVDFKGQSFNRSKVQANADFLGARLSHNRSKLVFKRLALNAHGERGTYKHTRIVRERTRRVLCGILIGKRITVYFQSSELVVKFGRYRGGCAVEIETAVFNALICVVSAFFNFRRGSLLVIPEAVLSFRILRTGSERGNDLSVFGIQIVDKLQ